MMTCLSSNHLKICVEDHEPIRFEEKEHGRSQGRYVHALIAYAFLLPLQDPIFTHTPGIIIIGE